jgi:DNA repair exonuclease SbcCD ATPase subunit
LLKEADDNEDADYDAQINDINENLSAVREKMNEKSNNVNEANKNAQELSEKKLNLQKQSDEAQKECEEWMTKQSEYERNIETLTAIVENGKSACPTCGTMLDLSDEELNEKKEQLDCYKEQLIIAHEKVMEKDAIAYNLEKEANAIIVPELVTPDTTEEQNEIQRLNDLLAEVKAIKAIADNRKTQIAAEEAAIETLEASRKEFGAKLAQNERKKIAADKYVQDAAEMLSKAVNGNLKDTRIQMFETLKNGEQKPSCIITDKQGVKYSTLNFSARMLCNVEIARMFCRLLDVNIPCFVDECSVFDSNHLPTIDGTQMIYMRCSDDQKLVVL